MFREIVQYLDSVKARDPAARSRWEVLLYPGVWALAAHRLANFLYRGELFLLARIVNHVDHRAKFFHRPWVHRHRGNGADRRRCHRLSMRDPGRHQPRQWYSGQAAPDPGRRRDRRLGSADSRPHYSWETGADRCQCGRHPRRSGGRDDGRDPCETGSYRRGKLCRGLHSLWHPLQREVRSGDAASCGRFRNASMTTTMAAAAIATGGSTDKRDLRQRHPALPERTATIANAVRSAGTEPHHEPVRPHGGGGALARLCS